MRFKVDENLPVEIAELIRHRGHDALTATQQQLGGRPDKLLSEVCVLENRCLVTLDLDFADIRTYPPSQQTGIIVLRPSVQTIAALVKMVGRILPLLDNEVVTSRLWIVDESRVRIRGDDSVCDSQDATPNAD